MTEFYKTRDIEDIFRLWEIEINKKEKADSEYSIAERNYNSIMTKNIVTTKETHGSTLAKDIAKGREEVLQYKSILDEKERMINACKDKIEFLRELETFRRKEELDLKGKV